mgnify:CR=1 FL=1
MTTILVRLNERSYPVVIASSYARLENVLKPLGLSQEGWLISHRSLLARHGREVTAALRRAGWTVTSLTVPEAETSKSLAMAEWVIDRLARRATMRVPVLFAFGGGVVGDLAGFVAAVFRRGIPYVQLPTTLLAQVDSGIGGKVGVDLPQAKNFVGAFYQPRLVWNNVTLLRTLPLRQRRSGLAEVIKYGIIADPGLFRLLERRLGACLAMDLSTVRKLVERSCAIKARIVSRDEEERKGLRHQLNFGHTVGHALEAATRYRRWTHGEAIAIGMCAAAELGLALGMCPERDVTRITRLLQAAGLPTHAAGVSRRAVWGALRYDKKFLYGRPRWVLPTRIGQVVVTESVPESVVRRVLERYVT